MHTTATGAINWLAVFYSVLLTGVLVVSCTNTTPKMLPDPLKPIDAVSKTTADVSKGMGTVADNIDKHVVEVRKATPAPLVPKIGPQLDGINTETGTLRTLRGQLDGTQTELTQAKDDVNSLTDLNTKQAADIKKLTDEKNSALRNLMIWVILLSVVGVGVSGALVYTGQMWGISIGFGCLITLGLAIFITQYSMWFAIGAVVLLLGGLGYVAYQLFIRKKTATQLVQTVEANKMAMSVPARLHLFGNGGIPGHVDLIQSATTKEFVQKVRSGNKVHLAPAVTPVSLA
jgi:hypothetical protein